MTDQLNPIQQLIDNFDEALNSKDWGRIETLDKHLVACVTAEIEAGQLPADELAALLTKLKSRHSAVLTALETHKGSLAVEMRSLRNSHTAANKYLSNLGKF
ncbi:MAG: hypothetical protein H7A00_01495 [Hahellaceae bacterium]|nr:hypothetical protein [Hahellaceae bacterium]